VQSWTSSIGRAVPNDTDAAVRKSEVMHDPRSTLWPIHLRGCG